MLEDSSLAKIALVVSLIGVAGLICLNYLFEQKITKISDVNGLEGKKVLVAGKIEWFRDTGNTVLFGINDGEKIKAVMFRPRESQRKIIESRGFVLVRGKIELTGEQASLLAEEIREWK